MRVGIVTCMELPEPDPDQQPLLDALQEAGIDARLIAWDDPNADPGELDLCILRSTWNYPHEPEKFQAWGRAAATRTRLLNSAEVVAWNLHKRYLLTLEADGIPIIPTALLHLGEPADLPRLIDARGWSDIVIKPAISAGSLHTRRFNETDDWKAAGRFLESHLPRRDMLVQRYMPSVETLGERALIWIDGRLTHAVRKNPRFADDIESVSEALAPTPAEAAFVEGVMAAQPFRELLYARVDVVSMNGNSDERGPGCESDSCGILLSELELIEPSLFLVQHPPAMQRLVSAIRNAGRTAAGSERR